MSLTAADLSLEQAPPISIPMRFFLTAPLFGLLASVLALLAGPELLINRWTPAVLAFTHLLTIGFVGMVMCGALLQMLPVLAGSPVPAVVPVGRVVHVFLVLGTLALVSSFLSAERFWMWTALTLLGCGFGLFILVVAVALIRVRLPNITIVGMALALAALVVTVGFGLYLGAAFSGLINNHNLVPLVRLHLSWGFLGWIGLLLVAVAYQVVPMFQVTPDYPLWLRRLLVSSPFVGLVLWMPLEWLVAHQSLAPGISVAWLGLLALAYPLFAVATLGLQRRRRRKRKIPDNTLSFWRCGLLGILVSYLLWLAAQVWPVFAAGRSYPFLLGGGLLFSAMALVNGMLYKIVPFLSWFHLQHRQVKVMSFHVQVPNMKELLPDRPARIQLRLFVTSWLLALGALLGPGWFVWPAGLLFAVSNLLLGYNLVRAVLRYRKVHLALRAEELSKAG